MAMQTVRQGEKVRKVRIRSLVSHSGVRLSVFSAVIGFIAVMLAAAACSNSGGESRQEMNNVTAEGPGLVAVGLDDSGGDPDAAVWTSAAPPDPKVLLERSRSAMAMLDSARMEMDLTVKLSEEPGDEIMFNRIEYSGRFDGDQQLSSTSDFSGAPETYVVRMVGGTAYYKDSSTDEWKIADEDAARGAQLSIDEIRELFTDIGKELDPKTLTIEVASLDGLPVYHITGAVPENPPSEHVELWVGIEDLLVRQQLLDGHAPAPLVEGLIHGGLVTADSGEVFHTVSIRFSQFNQPVALVAPVLVPSAD